MDAASLFELELVRRGVTFERDRVTGTYQIFAGRRRVRVDPANLVRRVVAAVDPDDEATQVRGFVDAVLDLDAPTPTLADLTWNLTPRDDDSVARRVPVTPRLDRVLIASVDDGRLLRWADDATLAEMGVDEQTATDAGFANLDAAVRAATLHTDAVDDTVLGWFETDFVAKASLLLAPALREVVAPIVGWPVCAIVPARDYAVLWPADRPDVAGRLSSTVAREYLGSPYPLSAEVVRLDGSVTALGAFDV